MSESTVYISCTYDIIAMIGTSDQSCLLAEACKILLSSSSSYDLLKAMAIKLLHTCAICLT